MTRPQSDNHARGEFEGQVLARLDELRTDVAAIFGKLNDMTDRCMAHSRIIARNDVRVRTAFWLVGGLFSGLLALGSGLLYLVLR